MKYTRSAGFSKLKVENQKTVTNARCQQFTKYKIPWYSEVNIFDFTVINAMPRIELRNMELELL